MGLARGGLRKAGQLAVEGEPFAQDVPEAGVEALENGGVERAFAPRLGVPDRPVGVEQAIAHGRRPRLMIEFDQRLEFAQMMGVAERVARPFEGAIGFEAVMDGHAAGKRVRHVAPPVRDAVEREAFGCDRVQPLRFAGDPEARLVETAPARRGDERADPRGRRRKRVGFSSHPIHHARRRDGGTPKRSASVSAVLSSGINGCRWR